MDRQNATYAPPSLDYGEVFSYLILDCHAIPQIECALISAVFTQWMSIGDDVALPEWNRKEGAVAETLMVEGTFERLRYV